MVLKNNLFQFLCFLVLVVCFMVKTSLEISKQQKLPTEIIHLISTLADQKTKGRIFETMEYFRKHLIDFNINRLTPLCSSVLEKKLQSVNYKENQFWKFCKKNKAPSSIKNLKIDEKIYNVELPKHFLELSSLIHNPINPHLPLTIFRKEMNFIINDKDKDEVLNQKIYNLNLFFDKEKNMAISCNTEIQDSKELVKFIENINKCYNENNIVRISFQKNNFEKQSHLIDENSIPLLINKKIGGLCSFSSFLLHDLAYGGHKNSLELLLKTGKNPNEKTLEKRSPLHSACVSNDIECVKLLLQYGAHKNAQNLHGSTPLHIAVKLKNSEIVKLILEHGAKVNIKDKEGRTPLHIAVKLEDSEIVKLLLEHGAKVNIKDKEGRTPLWNVDSYRNSNISKLLLDYGADYICDNDGHCNSLEGTVKSFLALLEKDQNILPITTLPDNHNNPTNQNNFNYNDNNTPYRKLFFLFLLFGGTAVSSMLVYQHIQ